MRSSIRPRKNLPVWNGSARGDALERNADVVNRVRRKLNAARIQANLSWEELFKRCDEDNSGEMDWRECKKMVRDQLKVTNQTIDDHELRVLFSEADEDKSGALDAAELLQFLQHGAKSPELEALRKEQRVGRVRKNLTMAFSRIGSSEAEARRLFEAIDLDGSSRLSQYEFNLFVRQDLSLNRWNVMNSDLDSFYRHLDQNGDGIDVDEFLDYLRQTHRSKGKLLGSSTFYTPPGPEASLAAKKLKMRKTFRQELEHSLVRSESAPAPRLTAPSFTNLGRTTRPRTRIAMDAALL